MPAMAIFALSLLILGVPPIFADDALKAADKIGVDVLMKSTAMWNGERLPAYAEGQPQLSVVRVTIPEGMALPLHEHPYATAGVLVQGRLEVRTPSGEQAILNAGDGLIELVNLPHAGANIGEGDAVIVVVYAGIEGQPVTRLVTPEVVTASDEPL
ncbi:hypothetical protein HRUBRA_02769 [Pseudohaliea rubra DSM 19751]|uniref:Cupin type-2 domain-containing protein n=2 Tax=Pseudohaliea TaxID=1341120 RepID=A0A095XSK0_9GAMM|nr:hypothetical protein HRUBRA_02769 [Pseudohaliea rubra DSM 19751]